MYYKCRAGEAKYMKTWQTELILLIIAGILGNGCQTANPHDHGGRMMAEYRPGWQFRQRQAPYSAVYVLYAWTKGRVPATDPAQPPPLHPERAYELRQVFARKGEYVGFGWKDGSLIGFAGPTVIPLEDAHYCWHMLPDDESRATDARRERIQKTFEIIGLVVVTVVVVVILVAIGSLKSN
jgi:hypothetical protein